MKQYDFIYNFKHYICREKVFILIYHTILLI